MRWVLVVAAVVLMVVTLVLLFRRRRGPYVPPPAGPLDPAALEREIRALLAQRRKIQAIKLLRDHVPMPLADAKRAVEQMQRGPLRVPGPPDLDGDTVATVRDLKRSGRVIEAVRLVRQRTGWGLAQSKAAVDRIS